MSFENAAKEFFISRLKLVQELPLEFEYEGKVYSLEQVKVCLGDKGLNEVYQRAFDWDEAQDYVATHGCGLPLKSARPVAEQLFREGDDYATIGHEIVALGLTSVLENERRFNEALNKHKSD